MTTPTGGPDCADEVDRVLDRDERLRREPEPAPNACELGIGDADSGRLGAVRCCGKPCSIDILGRTVCIVCRSQVLTVRGAP